MTDDALAQALARDTAALLQDSGAWRPTMQEQELAEDLARSPWDAHRFRAGLRELPPAVQAGRLVDVLAPAATVAEAASETADAALLLLRRLLDSAAPAP